VGDKLVFVIEQQSTLNWNMPLRILSYIARVYEKIVERRALYKTTLVKIPKPKCIVLYNGLEKAPERLELRLSDAFIGLEPGEKAPLDLSVSMYNINYGQNMELLQRSENLAGYAQFVAKVRENEASMPLEQAVTEAVRYCIKNRILGRFFEEHGGEVKNMAFGEWDWDEAKAAWQEEAWDKAWEEAVEKTEEKYRPMLAENQQALAEKQQALAENQQALAEKDRAIQELRRKLQEAGIDT
jgi:hypothetical protein